MSDYIPLSERGKPEAERAGPVEGVPEWLRSSLVGWVRRQLWTDNGWDTDRLQEVERNVRIVPQLVKKNAMLGRLPISNKFMHEADDLISRITEEGNDDLVLEVLNFLVGKASTNEYKKLDAYLWEGGSIWSVGAVDPDRFGLVRRVDTSFQDAADQAMTGDDQHHRYLQKAWSAAYGRNPQPGTAYRDAVRAVEAASIPVICPSQSLTLGQMIPRLKDQSEQFATRLRPDPPPPAKSLDSVAVVCQMMELLWKSEWDRHGVDDNIPLSVSQEEAEDALALAVTLVRWFDTGAVYRLD